MLAFGELLLDWNQRTNLVGAKSLEKLIPAHFLDSLAGLRLAPDDSPLVDVGSGAGLPGIVAALAYPRRRTILLEPRTKRAEFLAAAVAALGLPNAEVLRWTAQRAAREGFGDLAAVATARALAQPIAACGLALPLVRTGGRLLLYLGKKERPTEQESSLLQALRGRLLQAVRVRVPYLEAQRHVWLIEKIAVANVRVRGKR